MDKGEERCGVLEECEREDVEWDRGLDGADGREGVE